jgi:hypothetical protein
LMKVAHHFSAGLRVLADPSRQGRLNLVGYPPHGAPCGLSTMPQDGSAFDEKPAINCRATFMKFDFNALLETLAYTSGVFAGEAVGRIWSILFGSTGSIPIVPGCLHGRSVLISRTRSGKDFVHMQKTG